MNTDRIASLSCWKNEISCEPLSGGITNRNFLVHDGPTQFVARVCEDRSFLGIDRRNELICQRAAYDAGISPEVVHCENGVLVSRFIRAETLQDSSVREPEMLEQIALTLRRLHGHRDRIAGELLFFCPFQTVRTYILRARGIQANLPSDIDQLIDDSNKLSQSIGPYQPTLCHNDLLAANMLHDGSRLWMVDWEYAGIGNPLFDLASVCANSGLSQEAESHFLQLYAGTESRQLLLEMHILKTISLLREALWAVIQSVKSDLDFDFGKYAADNFSAYRLARSELNTHLAASGRA